MSPDGWATTNVIPAQAGIHASPTRANTCVDARLRGHDVRVDYAGMVVAELAKICSREFGVPTRIANVARG